MTDPSTDSTTAPRADQMPYRYFVSYSHGMGFGSIHITSNRPANNYETVETFRKTISDATNIPLHQIIILNYVPLAGPEMTDGRPSAAEQALREILSMVGQFDTPRDPGRVQAFVGDVRQVTLRGLGHTRG